MHRIDPEGINFRTHKRVKRADYHVNGPHSLWHIDGNHKLRKKFHIVIHAGIDGFSRTITYIQASDNNRSSTNYAAFRNQGVAEYGVPTKVRVDRGG